ncbi:MAG: PKD domain-containing protein, partial [Thermoplasmata archaeon]
MNTLLKSLCSKGKKPLNSYFTLILLLILCIAVNFAGCLEKKENTPDEYVPAKAVAPAMIYTYSGIEILLDASNSTGAIAEYEWDFDRTDSAGGQFFPDTTGKVVKHIYQTPGRYKVTLCVRGERGEISYDSTLVAVSYQAY